MQAYLVAVRMVGVDGVEDAVSIQKTCTKRKTGMNTTNAIEQCDCCGEYSATVALRRMNTAYEDDNMNWERTCLECHLEHEKHWEEAWQEYWAGRL